MHHVEFSVLVFKLFSRVKEKRQKLILLSKVPKQCPCFQNLTNEKHFFFFLQVLFKMSTECTIQCPCFKKNLSSFKFQDIISKSARMHRFASMLLKFSQWLNNVDRMNHLWSLFSDPDPPTSIPLTQNPRTTPYMFMSTFIFYWIQVQGKAPCLHLLKMFKFLAVQDSA